MIVSPVFVIGSGRSGLTPLMDLIAYHPAFAWPSQYQTRFPKSFRWAILSRILDFAPAGSRRKFARIVPRHSEAWAMWRECFYGFSTPFRDLTEADVTPHARNQFQRALRAILKYQGKERFIAELSGWSRVRFLKEIFPDAQFVHIVRDGRAVANSLINVDYWGGWEGIYKWRWGVPSAEAIALLEKYDFAFLALAAVQWRLLVENIRVETSKLDQGDFLLVRYEDLMADPRGETLKCIEFCGLDGSLRRFQRHLSMTVRTHIVDANTSALRITPWRETLTEAEVEMLNDIMAEELAAFGYEQVPRQTTSLPAC